MLSTVYIEYLTFLVSVRLDVIICVLSMRKLEVRKMGPLAQGTETRDC